MTKTSPLKIIDVNNRERECLRVFLDPAWPGYASVEFVSKREPGKTRIEWMPLADFASKNPSLTDLFKGRTTAPAPEVSGIVTKATKDGLIDSSSSWAPNVYAGFHLWISRGPGDGTTRTIMSNTKIELKLDQPWDKKKKPSKDSQYVITQTLPENTSPTGNILPITELRNLEEKARKMDIKAGRVPAERQYTK